MMTITPTTIKIKEIYNGYLNDDENGVEGYDGQLNIRPPYQREFVYKDQQRNAVIDTIIKGLPLNVMYWVKNEDGSFEVLDGQQRTISFCEYCEGQFSIKWNGRDMPYYALPKDIRDRIDNYELIVYICEGTDSEKLEWFQTINISGARLLEQELRNAVYYGPWLNDAKKYFSKRECIAKKIGEKYMTGDPNRQEYLEKVLSWISNDNIDSYMSSHKDLPNANDLRHYYQGLIAWIDNTFIRTRKEMKGVNWGDIYNKHQNDVIDTNALEKQIASLMEDVDVTNKKGIYEYLFDKDERHLSIRSFDDRTKRTVYEKQKGICPICGDHFELEEMEADHIVPWSKGGTTTIENCQMLCKSCNRQKSNK